jgi:hypothetical protein
MKVHTCNPTCSKGGDLKDLSSAQEKMLARLYLKKHDEHGDACLQSKLCRIYITRLTSEDSPSLKKRPYLKNN